MLQEVRREVGNDTFDQVFEHFDSIKNSGYTVEEIVSTGTDTLIDREEYIRYNNRTDAENENQDSDSDDGDDGIRHHNDEDDDADSNDGDDEAAMEEQLLQAVAASEASALEDGELRTAIEDSLELAANDNDNEDEEKEGEEEEMFATAIEDQHMRQAVAASEGSVFEDETMRIAIEESLFNRKNMNG